MTITSKYRGHCTACNAQILPGDQVNWTKGVKGVTCAACPMPTNGTPVAAAPVVSPELRAALADGQALRARIGGLVHDIKLLDAAALSQRTEIETLRAALAEARSVITQTANERNELRSERDELARNEVTRQAIPVITEAEVKSWFPPDVAAPQMREYAANALDADDDCPI